MYIDPTLMFQAALGACLIGCFGGVSEQYASYRIGKISSRYDDFEHLSPASRPRKQARRWAAILILSRWVKVCFGASAAILMCAIVFTGAVPSPS